MDGSRIGMSLEVGRRLSVPLNLSAIAQETPLLIAATIKPTVAQPHGWQPIQLWHSRFLMVSFCGVGGYSLILRGIVCTLR